MTFSMLFSQGPEQVCASRVAFTAAITRVLRGYKEEGTISTAFDVTVLHDLDRFHPAIDTLDQVPKSG